MSLTILLVFLTTFWAANCEIHSLMYIYTGISESSHHKFTAMGIMDGRAIDYFDNLIDRKVPKQPWMETSLPPEYWVKGTKTRQSKMQWFEVNISILRDRMRQNVSDTHILQWIHGCKGQVDSQGALSFHSGVDSYNYDGGDFLSYNSQADNWITANKAAESTKITWDQSTNLKDYTKTYLHHECIDWLKKFLKNEKEHRKTEPARPDVFVFAKSAPNPAHVFLTCLATGFLQDSVTLQMKMNGRVLGHLHQVQSSDVRPNHDGTFQIRDHVEILKTDRSEFSCQLLQEGRALSDVKVWDGVLPHSGHLVFIVTGVAICFVVLAVAGVLVFLYKRHKLGHLQKANEPEDPLEKASIISQHSASADSGLQNGSDKGSASSQELKLEEHPLVQPKEQEEQV